MANTSLLSINQVSYLTLLLEGKHSSDAAICRKLNIGVDSASRWRHNDENFKSAYDEVVAKKQIAIEEFDVDSYIEEKLVPAAMHRLDETLQIPITDKTDPARMRAITDAAKTVLRGTGRLAGDSKGGFSINILVANALAGDEPTKPPIWSKPKVAIESTGIVEE